MPITAGYSIDVYCDCEQCQASIDPFGRWYRAETTSATGETYAECAALIPGLRRRSERRDHQYCV